MAKFIDLTGLRFGRLTVETRVTGSVGAAKWRCVCDCGRETIATTGNMKNGHTTSCGCYQAEIRSRQHTTHGHAKNGAKHPLYATWCEMRHRCNNVAHKQFKDYGGRGISVCPEWQGKDGFKTFLADMGERPDGCTIDRANNDAGYNKSNCIWATSTDQSNNRRANRLVTIGSDTKTAAEWSRVSGVKSATIRYRIDVTGLSPEAAVFSADRREFNGRT